MLFFGADKVKRKVGSVEFNNEKCCCCQNSEKMSLAGGEPGVTLIRLGLTVAKPICRSCLLSYFDLVKLTG